MIIMDQVVRSFLVLAIAASSCTFCQELPVNYNARSIAGAGAGVCPATQNLMESIKQDIHSLINSSVLPALTTQNQTQTRDNGGGYGGCGCGGSGWRRAAYLNMSDPTQNCRGTWGLITNPRRTCARPYNAGFLSCYSAMFPIQGIQYSQVCGRIIGYQIGQPGAFLPENIGPGGPGPRAIDDQYVDGVSLTYGSPRQHIWTFANGIDESPTPLVDQCPCTVSQQLNVNTPPYVGSDYFCETGFPQGQKYMNNMLNQTAFHDDDPLWDGQGCGQLGACECTFNNPPWFCKQLPQSTNADLEVRLCSTASATYENTAIELIDIYVK